MNINFILDFSITSLDVSRDHNILLILLLILRLARAETFHPVNKVY